jgi:alpha-1,2-mannosyltransferase
LRNADFNVDRRLLISLMAMLIACYAGFIAWTYHDGFQKAERGERPLFTDFTSTYGAALLLRKEAAEYLYHPEHIIHATEEAGNAAYHGTLNDRQKKVGFAPWMYPPTFIAFVLPLGFLSYFGALAAWLAITAIPLLMAVRAIMNKSRLAIWLAVAAPPFFYNVMFGQTSFLPAGLIGLGLLNVLRRPYLAGVLIGLASIKPHLGVLIPFALLAGGHWRVFMSACATFVALILSSILAFGTEPWYAFIGITLFHVEGFQYGAYAWKIMTSVLSAAHLSGVSIESAWHVQFLASAICVALVALVWWRGRHRPDTFNLQAAVLCCAIPLAVPMIFLYDLVVLIIALAWLLQDMKTREFKHWEALATLAAMTGILLVKPLGPTPGVQIGLLSICSLLGLSLFRFWNLVERTLPLREDWLVTQKPDHV